MDIKKHRHAPIGGLVGGDWGRSGIPFRFGCFRSSINLRCILYRHRGNNIYTRKNCEKWVKMWLANLHLIYYSKLRILAKRHLKF